MAVATMIVGCTSGGAPTTRSTSTSTSTPTTSTSAPTTTTTAGVPSTSTSTSTTTTRPSTAALPVVTARPGSTFEATLEDIPLLAEGTWPGPAWPNSLDGVANVESVPKALRPALARNWVVIEPQTGFTKDWLAQPSQWSAVYDLLGYYYGQRPLFVTTDVVAHSWHLVFDKVLRDVEELRLLPVLERFLANAVEAARTQATSLEGTDVADAASRAQEFFEAAATVTGVDVGPIGDRAHEEVALVEAHADVSASPTVGGVCTPEDRSGCVDYSLMTPRGHYTRTEDLTRYFKGMSVLGSVGFSIDDPDTLRVGLLVFRPIVTDPKLAADWATLYDPTVFLVGTADDYTPLEAASAAGEALQDPESLADAAVVTGIGERLAAMRPVEIDAETPSARVMGTRFVLDAWILDQLTHPTVPNRTSPSGLDVASVFGDRLAADIQTPEATQYPGYADRTAELLASVEGRTVDEWGRTVYDAWLYALQAVWASKDRDVYPPLLRTDAWAAKELTTGLGSYTELKHDTILYAKQGFVEGESEEPRPIRHWVEPDPVTFRRYAAMARMLRDGLVSRELMTAAYDPEAARDDDPSNDGRAAVELLIAMADRLAAIADSELAGHQIADADNDWLGGLSYELSTIESLTATGYEADPSPLIADIFTDFTRSEDPYLEVATGPPDLIHVIVPDGDGGFQVADGAVFSYHEFWNGERLTDEEWWDLIAAEELPDRPSWWTTSFG